MGLSMICGKEDFSIGYGWFMGLRRSIVRAFECKHGTFCTEDKYFQACISGVGRYEIMDLDYSDKIINHWQKLEGFLFHSDCGGMMTPNQCKDTLVGLASLVEHIDEEHREGLNGLIGILTESVFTKTKIKFC